jgi:RNA polymerase sigma factor (sigma-70 family)
MGPALAAREGEDDLVQSICRDVLAGLPELELVGEKAFRRFLYLAAERNLRSRVRHWRAQRREASLDGLALERGDYPAFDRASELTLARDEAERLGLALAQLAEPERQVNRPCRIEGRSAPEVTRASTKSEGAVRVMLHRALAELARRTE